MLAYTAVDGLRAISRDFDLEWQPTVNDALVEPSRGWRSARRASARAGRQLLGALALVLPFGAIAWLQ